MYKIPIRDEKESLDNGFVLKRNNQYFLILTTDKKTSKEWKSLMSTYVIRRGVTRKFSFLQLLGNGSFANVHLVNKNLS